MWKQMITLRIVPGSVGWKPKTFRASQIKLSLGKCLRNIDSCRLRAVREKSAMWRLKLCAPQSTEAVGAVPSINFQVLSSKPSLRSSQKASCFFQPLLCAKICWKFFESFTRVPQRIKRKGEKAFKTRWKVNFNLFCFSLASQTALLSVLNPASLTPEKYLQI